MDKRLGGPVITHVCDAPVTTLSSSCRQLIAGANDAAREAYDATGNVWTARDAALMHVVRQPRTTTAAPSLLVFCARSRHDGRWRRLPPLGPEDAAHYRKWTAIMRERTALRAELDRLKMEKEIAALQADVEENQRLRLELAALRSRSSSAQLNEQASVERKWQEHIRLCDERRREIAAQERHARCSDEEKYTWRPGKVADRHRLGATIRATPNFYDALGDAGSSSTAPMQQPARPFPASPLTAPSSSPSPTSSSTARQARGPPPSPTSSSSARQVRGPPSAASTISSTSGATPVAPPRYNAEQIAAMNITRPAAQRPSASTSHRRGSLSLYQHHRSDRDQKTFTAQQWAGKIWGNPCVIFRGPLTVLIG